MNIEELLFTRLGGQVERWHTKPCAKQTIGHHTFGVLNIALAIAPFHVTREFIEAILWHDLPEYDTGDIPAPTKWRYPALDEAVKKAEQGVLDKFGKKFYLRLEEETIIDLADKFELVLYSIEEFNKGNRYMIAPAVKVMKKISGILPELDSDFAEESQELYNFIKNLPVYKEMEHHYERN